MTEDEKELVKAGADAAMQPFANLVEKLFGGAVEEIGGTWQDALKVRRFKRRLALLGRLKAKIDQSGLEAHFVPDNVSLAVFEAASREDNEVLQDKWASLLANASITDETFLPAYPEILRQLTSIDVRILDAMYQHARRNLAADTERSAGRHRRPQDSDKWTTAISANVSLNDVFESELNELQTVKSNATAMVDFERAIRVSVENLKRLGLVRIYVIKVAPDKPASGLPFLRFEMLGLFFTHASMTPEDRIKN